MSLFLKLLHILREFAFCGLELPNNDFISGSLFLDLEKVSNLIFREITCLYLAIIFQVSFWKLAANNKYFLPGSKMIDLILRLIFISLLICN